MSKSPQDKKSDLMRLLRLILPYKGLIGITLVSTIGYNIFSAVPAFYMKDIVDALLEGHDFKGYVITGVGIVIVFTFKGLFSFIHTSTVGTMVQRLLATLREKLFYHMQQLSLSFFDQSKTGDLIARFTNDLQVLQSALNVGVTGPFRDIPLVFFLLGIMVYRSWQLSVGVFVIVPLLLYFIVKFGQFNKRAIAKRQASFGKFANFIYEILTGIRVVKAFNMESYEQKRFDEHNEELYKLNMRSIFITAYSSPIIEIVGTIAASVILIYGGYLVSLEILTEGEIASFFVSFFMMNEPIKKLNGFNLKVQEGVGALERIFSIMDTPREIIDHPDAIEIKTFEDKIDIQINRFQYATQKEPALQDIKLEVKKGEVIALVGSSGSGKTTFANLIPRFYDINEGSLCLDTHDIKKIKLESLRSLISIVTQETILFNDTIANNISYGHVDCPQETMIAAAKAANAHDFIINQPEGYQTFIGEKGVKLSGGQRQRLSIARALLKDAPILILDEATSALDSESEIAVQQAIEHLMQNRTSLVIAHRLSTIRHAHRICVLEEGRIVEIGTHEELLAGNGRYQKLYEMQFALHNGE